MAAVAIARLAWRDSPVEDWHAAPASRISDPDLMRANAAVTREVRGLLASTPPGEHRLLDPGDESGDDVGGLLAAVPGALTDPDRRLPDGQRLHQFAPCAAQLSAYTDHVVELTR